MATPRTRITGTAQPSAPTDAELGSVAQRDRRKRILEKLDRTPIPGETPYDRMLYVLGRTTRAKQREPMLTEAMTRAFMFADPSAAAEVNTVARLTARIGERRDQPPRASRPPPAALTWPHRSAARLTSLRPALCRTRTR